MSPHKNNIIPTCRICGRRIAEDQESEYCLACQDQMLFAEVRDYIRENDVRDWQVAQHFGIPIARVKKWIRDGRIQYKDEQTARDVIMERYCQVCGKLIDFGSVCTECMQKIKLNERHGSLGAIPGMEHDKMHFLDDK